jgi:hypothetical protein
VLYHQFTYGDKLLNPSNHNSSEAAQEIHFVCCKECFPKICFFAVCKMSIRGEVYLGAVGCEEDVFIDKEAINCQSNILLELDELSLGTLTILCTTRLPFLLTVFPFIMRTDRP